jgi:hypothetical protein
LKKATSAGVIGLIPAGVMTRKSAGSMAQVCAAGVTTVMVLSSMTVKLVAGLGSADQVASRARWVSSVREP